jgi:hypothetical protein
MVGQLFHNEQTVWGVSAAWTGWNPLSPGLPGTVVLLALAAHPDGWMHAVMTMEPNIP